MSFDWKGTLATVAPTIATALAGPLGGVAVKMIADNLDIEPNEQAIASLIESATPETLGVLQATDNEFKLEMEKLGVEVSKIHAGDRKNARNMAINTTILPQVIIASIFVMAFAVILYQVFSGGQAIPAGMKEPAMYLLGILSAGLMQVLNFFFGSSAGSKNKDHKTVLQA